MARVGYRRLSVASLAAAAAIVAGVTGWRGHGFAFPGSCSIRILTSGECRFGCAHDHSFGWAFDFPAGRAAGRDQEAEQEGCDPGPGLRVAGRGLDGSRVVF